MNNAAFQDNVSYIAQVLEADPNMKLKFKYK